MRLAHTVGSTVCKPSCIAQRHEDEAMTGSVRSLRGGDMARGSHHLGPEASCFCVVPPQIGGLALPLLSPLSLCRRCTVLIPNLQPSVKQSGPPRLTAQCMSHFLYGKRNLDPGCYTSVALSSAAGYREICRVWQLVDGRDGPMPGEKMQQCWTAHPLLVCLNIAGSSCRLHGS
jgi:hypothetical protein